MFLFNKKLIMKITVILSLIFMVGCSDANKVSSNKSSSNTNRSSTNKIIKNDNSNSNSKQNNEEDNLQSKLLQDIKTLAAEGKVINCEYPAKVTNLYSVEEKWGKADSSNWVASAKGMYSTYSKHNVVFGSNKGARIFEVRSFDSRLNKISLSMVRKNFGTPQYNVRSNGEEIMGYVVTTEFKLLFVFPEPTKGASDPLMRHYSVLYPSATANSMASDPGRQW